VTSCRPNQAPQHYIDPYTSTIADKERQIFAGMLSAVDEGMGNVTAALGEAGMLDDTLILVTTDNGGPTTECSTTGQSNWPLRGSKCRLMTQSQSQSIPFCLTRRKSSTIVSMFTVTCVVMTIFLILTRILRRT
jgi:arylsulfatase A-like enzyme